MLSNIQYGGDLKRVCMENHKRTVVVLGLVTGESISVLHMVCPECGLPILESAMKKQETEAELCYSLN